jgi:hypothetical protein
MLGVYATKFVGEFPKLNSKAWVVDPGMANHLSSLTNDPNMRAQLANELTQNSEALIAKVVSWTRTGAKGPKVADDLPKTVAMILGAIARRLIGERAQYPKGAGDLPKAIAKVVHAITFIRVAYSVPDLRWLLQGGRRDVLHHDRDLWRLRDALLATIERLPAHMAYYKGTVREQDLAELLRMCFLLREVLEALLGKRPPVGRGRPAGTRTVKPWHIHAEVVADSVVAVLRANGHATVSRKAKDGPFARMMAAALQAINGEKYENEAIVAHFANPRKQRSWAINCASILSPPLR